VNATRNPDSICLFIQLVRGLRAEAFYNSGYGMSAMKLVRIAFDTKLCDFVQVAMSFANLVAEIGLLGGR
jgi:hypothetical protein